MSQILFVKKVPLGRFYQRRISRIIPVFLLFTISVYTFSAWMKIEFSSEEVISTLLFLRTYIPSEPGIWDGPVPIDHLWTLNIEEHSYILMSLLTLWAFTRKSPAIPLLGLGLVSQLIVIYYLKNPDIAAKNFELRIECALSFIFYSAGYDLLKHHFRKFILPWMPILTLIFATACYTNTLPWWSSFFTPALLAFSVNHLSETWQPFLRFLSLPGLRLLGLWSYSIYLWQQPFAEFKQHFYPGMAFLLAMAAGIASFYLFENPSRRWINHYWENRKAE